MRSAADRRWVFAWAWCLASVLSLGCGARLPPITIDWTPVAPPAAPTPEPAQPAPEPVTPAPVVEPELPELPLVDLALVVHDAAGVGIAAAACVVNGEARRADGSGFIHFPVRGGASVLVACSAPGYVTRATELLPGHQRFALASVAPAPTPPPAACSAAENTGRVSQACLAAVATRSRHWPPCEAGDGHSCHYYVREVAVALRETQDDPRWGIVRRTGGGFHVDGFAEDVVAYLPAPLPLDVPTWQWRGADIVGGAREPGARFQAGALNAVIACPHPEDPDGSRRLWCNRTTDYWSAVPR